MLKIRRWLKAQALFLERFALYLAVNLFGWPLVYPALFVAAKLGHPIFGYIFVVYPGSLDQVRGYMPIWMRHVIPIVSPIGIVSRGATKRGLVMTIPWTIEEMEDDPQRLAATMNRARFIARAIGAESIALAGRMPSIISQYHGNGALQEPFVRGDKGSVYTVLLSVLQAVEQHGMRRAEVRVGILGYGFIGSRLASSLTETGFGKVVAVDPRARHEKDNGIFLTRDPVHLESCDVVVVLTARGEQVDVAVDYLKHGVVVVDDTHPQLPRRLSALIRETKSGTVIKATLGMDGVRFIPRLPKWQASWLPGCTVEALVAASSGFGYNTQGEFNAVAHEMDFHAHSVENQYTL